MSTLASLEQAHTFPPRRFLLFVWITTLLFAIAGLIATPGYTVAIYTWSVITIIAVWQLWTLRWIQLDRQGVSARNIFRHAQLLRWEEITEFKEQEVQLNRGTYSVVRLSNHGAHPAGTRATRITLTNDQSEFVRLRDMLRAELGPR